MNHSFILILSNKRDLCSIIPSYMHICSTMTLPLVLWSANRNAKVVVDKAYRDKDEIFFFSDSDNKWNVTRVFVSVSPNLQNISISSSSRSLAEMCYQMERNQTKQNKKREQKTHLTRVKAWKNYCHLEGSKHRNVPAYVLQQIVTQSWVSFYRFCMQIWGEKKIPYPTLSSQSN